MKRYDFTRKYRNMKNKGFTLVELIVTMTLMAILLGIVFTGLSSWIKWTNFTKQNESAEAIFVCAQNQLTSSSENGQLSVIQDALGGSGSYTNRVDVESLTAPDGNLYDLNTVFQWSADKTTTETNADGTTATKSASKNYQDTICYIKWTAQEYQDYIDPNKSVSKEIEAMLDLLTPYIYDPEVLNASVCIEFTPDEGQVFAVQYSQYAENGFQYGDDPNTGKTDIRNRTRAFRWDTMVGYYGADTLSKSTSRDLKKPVIADLMLNNEETLNLSFRLSKISQAINQLTYDITVYDTSKKKYLKIELDGTKVGNNTNLSIGNAETNMTAQQENNLVLCTVTFEDGREPIEMYFRAWISGSKSDLSDAYLHLVLDGADLNATSDNYNKMVNAMIGSGGAAATDKLALQDTFSFHRFGLEELNANTTGGDKEAKANAIIEQIENMQIYCTVEGHGNLYKNTTPKTSNTEHAYFEKTSTALNGDKTVTISNARHLYNIRYIEDLVVGTGKGEGNNKQAGTTAYTYQLDQNIDWAQFVKDQYLYCQGAPTTAKTGDKVREIATANTKHPDYLSKESVKDIGDSKYTEEGTAYIKKVQYGFPSIENLRAGCTLTGKTTFSGDAYTISGLQISDAANDFASLYVLTKSNIYKVGADGKIPVDADGNLKADSVSTDENPAGLFLTNSGSIHDLNLDKITVSSENGGGNKVGAFCAVNAGELNMLTVLNTLIAELDKDGNEKIDADGNTIMVSSSTVTGKYNVGGIVGYDAHEYDKDNAANNTITLEELNNNADVTGDAYVGGIIGKAEIAVSNNKKEYNNITIKDCSNYGAVSGSAWNSMCIGGIVGYAKDSYMAAQSDKNNNQQASEPVNHLVINNCTSSPQYHGISSDDYENYLNGIYVGGIVGYNDEAELVGCSTTNESQQEAYIFGYQYVGGIVGFNVGDATGALKGMGGVNAANVIGHEYVGGVVGCNAVAAGNSQVDMSNIDTSANRAEKVVEPDNNPTGKITVENWTNKGVVVCMSLSDATLTANGLEETDRIGQYAGGIAGFNTGIIQDCMSAVSGSTTATSISKVQTGDYAGGIVGYNNGTVRRAPKKDGDATYDKNKKLEAVCYVTGRNYIGGIVGYNDVNAEVSDYRLTGGTISGEIYVGGYAGFNASASLLANRSLVCRPNAVKGTYCVGGIIGGNIISATDGNGKTLDDFNEAGELTTHFETNNFLGTIKAEAIAGGYIGYNQLVAYSGDVKTQIENAETAMVTALNKTITTNGNGTKTLNLTAVYQTVYTKTDDSKVAKFNADTPYRLVITTDGTATDVTTQTTLSGVTAEILVGGVLGYNESNSALTVQNVINQTPIKANSSIETDTLKKDNVSIAEQEGLVPYDSTLTNKKYFQYAYAGGIIGKVGKYTIIDNCSNKNSGDVSSDASYLGGLAEINEGQIINCTATAIGKSGRDYVGGIVGLNKTGAAIDGCIFAGGTTVTGRTLIGGIAAENYGTIQNITLGSTNSTANVTAYGSDIGGLVGKNYTTGTIQMKTNSQSYVTIDAPSSENVGGIVGENIGKLEVDNAAQINGSISGSDAVGGVVGLAENAAISNFVNNATVNATLHAGGIVGKVTDNTAINISNCVNRAKITSTGASYAGGIISNCEAGSITNCANKGNIEATSGTAGGIAAKNGGTITECAVNPEKQTWWQTIWNAILNAFGITDTNSSVQIRALNNVGGIVGENGITVRGNDGADHEYKGTVSKSAVENAVVSNTEKSVDSSMVGGVAGVNNTDSTIGDTTVTSCTVQTYPSASNLGGVAGVNNGSISMTAKDHSITTHAITYTDDTDTTDTYHITTGFTENKNDSTNMYVDCVTDTDIKPANNAYTNGNIGGITGINNGSIENAAVSANITGKSGSESFGYGGIAGVNMSTIKKCSYQSRGGSGDRQGIIAGGTNVNVGGIAGLNGTAGMTEEQTEAVSIEDCVVGMQYNTDIANHIDGNTASGNVGGIVGLHYGKILNCDNYKYSSAEVYVVNDAGNVAGVAGTVKSDYAVASGTSKTQMLSTGQNWKVTSYATANDNGIGGILGYSESGRNIEYTDNHAEVFVNYDAKATMAGFIGRTQIIVSGMWMKNCTNYGEISSIAGGNEQYAGGYIGRAKYQMVSFDNCKNYASITAGLKSGGTIGNNRYAAGFIADQTNARGKVYMNNCYNFGNIRAMLSAGLIANKNSSEETIYYYFTDCVNVGTITGGKQRAGLSSISTSGQQSQNFVRCRNYGTLLNNDGKALSNYAARKMDCFSLTTLSSGAAITDDAESTTTSKTKRTYYVNNNSAPSAETAASWTQNSDNSYTITLGSSGKTLPESNEKQLQLTSDPLTMAKDTTAFAYQTDMQKGSRQLAFEEIDRALEKYYKTVNGTSLPAAPTALTLSQGAGQLNLSWTAPSATAYGYLLKYTTDGGTEKTVELPFGAYTTYSLNIQENGWTEGSTIQFELYTYNYAGDTRVESATAAEASYTILKDLPTPQVHLEYLGNSTYCYVLENASEYPSGTKISGTATINVTEGKFAYSKTVQRDSNGAQTYNFTATKTGYADSQRVTAAAYTLKGGSIATCTDVVPNQHSVSDFNGNLTDNMSIPIKISALATAVDIYLNSELFIPDYKLSDEFKIDTAVSYDTAHATFSGAVTAQLKNFPSDLLSYPSLTVRSYLWRSQNYMSWYGYQVQDSTGKTAFTKSELLAYLNTAKNKTGTELVGLIDENHKDIPTGNNQTVTMKSQEVFVKDADKVKLNDNYVLRLNTDGTYTILYVPAGAENTSLKKTYDVNKNNSQKVVSGTYSKDIRPTPVIPETVINNDQQADDYGLKVQDNTYTFQWDAGAVETDANYKVQLYGVEKTLDDQGNEQEKETLLKTMDSKAAEQEAGVSNLQLGESASCTFTDTTNAWNYTNMRLEVTRYGETDNKESTGKTTIFPSTATKTFTVKRRLSQISRPTAPTLTNGNKNELLYDLTWEDVPLTERDYVSGYEVTAVGTEVLSKDNTTPRTAEKMKKLYVEMGAATEDNTTYTWTKTDGNVKLQYTAVFTTAEDGTISRTLTAVWSFAKDKSSNASTITQCIDLSSFERAEQLSISVTAIATKDNSYRDGPAGVPRNFQMPSRMVVPIGAQTSTPEYDANNSQAITASKNLSGGLKLTFTADNQPEDMDQAQSFYQIAAAIYETAPTAEEQAADIGTIVSTDWNKDAIKNATLYGKDTNTSLTWDGANSNAASFTIPESKLSADYAGYWLKIAVRAVSDSNISSYWSDEDPASDATVNYYWVRIPRGKVQTPTIRRIADTNITSYVDFDDAKIASVIQPTLSIAATPYTDQYRMMLVQNGETDSTLFMLYAEAADEAKTKWNIFVQSTETDFAPEIKENAPICEQDSTACYVGTIDKDSDLTALPLTCNIEDSFNTNVWLNYDTDADGTSKFTLVLPDAEMIEGLTTQKLFIDQVLVQARVSRERDNGRRYERYADSNIFSWYRTVNGDKTVTENTAILSDWAAAPTVNTTGAQLTITAKSNTNSADSSNCFTLTSNPNDTMLLYKLEILDKNGKVVNTRYLSAEMKTAEDDTSTMELNLPDSLYEKYCGIDHADYTLRYSAAIVYDVTAYTEKGGISNWSESQTAGIMPLRWLPVPTVNVTLSAADAENTENCCQLKSDKIEDGLSLIYELQVVEKASGKEVKTETMTTERNEDNTTTAKLKTAEYTDYCGNDIYALRYRIAYKVDDVQSDWSEWRDAGTMPALSITP